MVVMHAKFRVLHPIKKVNLLNKEKVKPISFKTIRNNSKLAGFLNEGQEMPKKSKFVQDADALPQESS